MSVVGELLDGSSRKPHIPAAVCAGGGDCVRLWQRADSSTRAQSASERSDTSSRWTIVSKRFTRVRDAPFSFRTDRGKRAKLEDLRNCRPNLACTFMAECRKHVAVARCYWLISTHSHEISAPDHIRL